MASKSIPIENQDFPQDNFAQDTFDDSIQESFEEVTQELDSDFSQDPIYDDIAQLEAPEIVNQQKKKR
ncbi:hypothetical protein [Acinetobacter modestus]|uniref:Uncharacterized protein n=1 Tax=Acinetobacter modestus TaxID=1776740 RepID=A0ABN0JP89_9GAMM|nr:hypothetical protein [Acinetobacter modestus]ENU27110.1 hypothetical protein F992_01715 [Acinetobacter modestus]GGA18386.1 hypothetical protein GCM10017554_14060 [Acinetobacter modestus]